MNNKTDYNGHRHTDYSNHFKIFVSFIHFHPPLLIISFIFISVVKPPITFGARWRIIPATFEEISWNIYYLHLFLEKMAKTCQQVSGTSVAANDQPINCNN